MNTPIDLTGKRFGRWTVIKEADRQRPRKWVCLCDCGNIKEVYQYSLTCGDTKSCGCLANEEASLRWKNKDHSSFSNYKEFKAGQRFGRLTIIGDSGKRTKDRNKVWKCVCDCGNIVEVPTGKLKIGDSKSCGCLNDETLKNNMVNFVENFIANDCVENTALTKIDCSAPIRKDNTSGIRGVYWHKQAQKWGATITFQKKHYALGLYSDINEAAKVRKLAEEQLFNPMLEKYKEDNPNA